MIKLQKIHEGHNNYILTCITYNPNIGINPPDAYKVATLVRYLGEKKPRHVVVKLLLVILVLMLMVNVLLAVVILGVYRKITTNIRQRTDVLNQLNKPHYLLVSLRLKPPTFWTGTT